MKKIRTYITLIFTLGFIAISHFSCDDKKYDADSFFWKQDFQVFASPDGLENFYYATNLEDWVLMELDINFTLGLLPDKEVSKVDFYLYYQEIVNGKIVMHGAQEGKKLVTKENLQGQTSFKLHVTLDDIYNLYKDDLQNLNRPQKVLTTDLFELKYVITDTDGKVADTRINCEGQQCQYIFGVEEGVVPEFNLEGTCNYTFLEKGPGSSGSVGKTGSITISRVTLNGEYSIDDAEFGGSWNGKPVPGKLIDDTTGRITLDTPNYNVWEFSNFNGTSVDVKFTNKWTTEYNEWVLVRLTRTDGKNWPTFLRGANQ